MLGECYSKGLMERSKRRALVDAETIGQPVGHQLLSDRRIVMLTVLGAGFVFSDEAKCDVHPFGFAVVVHFAGLRYRKHVVAAVQDQIRTIHVLKMSFEREVACLHHRFLHAAARRTPI